MEGDTAADRVATVRVTKLQEHGRGGKTPGEGRRPTPQPADVYRTIFGGLNGTPMQTANGGCTLFL
jgi:hypothetical protein